MRVPEHVVFREFETETVVLNLQSGYYYGLNPTAGRMLERLRELGSLEAAAAALCNDFDATPEQIEGDVGALCHDLIERGVLQIDPSPRG